MSHIDHTLQDAFRVKKGLYVTGNTTLSGNLIIGGALEADYITPTFDSLSAMSLEIHDGLRNVSQQQTGFGYPWENIVTTTVYHPLSVQPDTIFYGNVGFQQSASFSGVLNQAADAYFGSNVYITGDLFVDGNAYLSAGTGGVINVGDTNNDVVVFTADVNSNIIPNQNMTHDLGTVDKHWNNIFTHDLSAHGDVDVNVDLKVGGDTTVEGNTVLSGAVDVKLDTTLHADLTVSGDTTIGSNTLLGGTLSAKSDVTFDQNVHIKGDLRVDGNAYLSAGVDGNIYVGDKDTDNVIFEADIDSNIIPNQNMTYDLGTVDKHWSTIYTHDLSAHGDVDINNNLGVSGDTTLAGAVTAQDDMHVKGDLRVDGDVWFNANNSGGTNTIHLGDDNTDNVIFNADVNSNIIPDQNMTFDLGTVDKHWSTIYTHDLSAHGDVDINNNLGVYGTFALTGQATLQSDLSVTGDTTLTGAITAQDDMHVKGDLRVDGDVWFNANNPDGTNTINLGDDNTDNVIFNADVNSNIIPDQNMTFDLGTADKHWNNVFTHDLSAHGVVNWSTGGSLSADSVYTTTNTNSAVWDNARSLHSPEPVLNPTPATVLDTYNVSERKSAKYLVEIEDVSSGTGTSGEVLFTEASVVASNNNAVSVVQFGQNYTTSEPFVQIVASINTGEVQIRAENINGYTNLGACKISFSRYTAN